MSDFLFAQPGFLSGMSRVWDLGATFDTYNESQSGTDADLNAARSDWMAVGADLRNAMSKAASATVNG